MSTSPELLPDMTRAEIRAIGKKLKERIQLTPDNHAEIKQLFKSAYRWRDSHEYPMTRIRMDLSGRIRALQVKANAVARIKRMASIRKKLREQPIDLSEIQDLAGCRVILPTMDDVHRFLEDFRNTTRHQIERETPYIERPRSSGYRSHHIVCRYSCDKGNPDNKGKRVEIQVRTRLQHSWATAVEAVGLFRAEHLKSGTGDKDWLRLFALMSSEMARAEKMPTGELGTNRDATIAEIRKLNYDLDADRYLDNIRSAFRQMDETTIERADSYFFRIVHDHIKKTVTVSPYTRAITVFAASEELEQEIEIEENQLVTTVIIGADRISALREAYPNYFGDVELFRKSLKEVVSGKAVEDYTFNLPERIVAKPEMRFNPNWMMTSRFNRKS